MGFRKLTVGPVEVLLSVDPSVRRKLRGAPSSAAETDGNSVHIPQPSDGSLRGKVESLEWYHTIDLGGGIVTAGVFDHAPYLHEYKLPESLEGKRVLDVASMDGFWAFELEKRGAREVVAIDVESFADIDFPPAVRARIGVDKLAARKTKEGFQLARETLGSKVQLEYISVYDLSPERLGTFDFVFCSDLLLHLTNPPRALQRICSVTSGVAQIVELYYPVFPAKTLNYEGGKKDCVWWSFSYECLRAMIEDAGFASVELLNKFPIGGRGQPPNMWHAAFRATR